MQPWEYAVIIAVVAVVVGFGIFAINNTIETQKIIDKGMAEWQAEHDYVLKASCSELHDGLLFDTINASDNRALASTHYVSGCLKKQ